MPAHNKSIIVFITQSRFTRRHEVVAVDFDRFFEKLIPVEAFGAGRIFSQRIRFKNQHGAARIWIPGADDLPHTVQIIGRSSQFGLLALFRDEQAPVNVDITQNLNGLTIKRQDAIELLNQVPRWHRNLLSAFGMRLHQAFTPKRVGHRPRLIAILHASEEYRCLSSTLIRRLRSLGEDVTAISDNETTLATVDRSISLLDKHEQLRNPHEIRSEASAWNTVERCFLDVRLNTNTEYLSEVLQDADAVYCCFEPVCGTAVSK